MINKSKSITVKERLHSNKFDMKNVLLHGYLEEEIYMQIPSSLRSIEERDKVCTLKKAL